MRGRIITTSAPFAAAIVILAACEVIFPLHVEPSSPPDSAADAPDVVVPPSDAGADTAIACVHAAPPSPPPNIDGDSGAPFVVAVKTLTLNGGTSSGYDLDGVCTCITEGASCITSAATAPCDGPEGQDNAGNAALSQLDGFLHLSRAGSIEDRINRGKFTYLFQISHYNELPNDPAVTVGGFRSDGIILDDAGAVYGTPNWDGNDTWTVDTDNAIINHLDGGGFAYTPTSVTIRAYVSEGTLVARLPGYDLGFSAGHIALPELLLVATITPDHHLTGQLVGRVPLTQVFEVFTHFEGPNGEPLCPGDSTYESFRLQGCQNADIASDPKNDGKDMACDAFSIGWPFEAVPAKLGDPWTNLPSPSLCDGGVDASCAP